MAGTPAAKSLFTWSRNHSRHCVIGLAAMLAIDGVSAHEIPGSPDDLKLRSSATLFAEVAGPGSVFEQVLVKYFGSTRDDETLRLAGPPSG